MNEQHELVVDTDFPQRLDAWLSETLSSFSRSKIKNWCKEGLVLVEGVARKGSFTVHEGQKVEITIPEEKTLDAIIPEEIPLNIVHEDDHIVIVDKEPGMVVHPGAGVWSGTLVHALAWHFDHLSSVGGNLRPGIVHRLDKGTSGLILVAKTDEAHANLSQQWQNQEVTKVYQALVWGIPDPPEGEITSHIGRHPKQRQMMAPEVEGGRFAHSRYKVVDAWEEAARLNVHILTGRTHQIRVHLAHIGHPVVGDAMYGKGRHRNLSKAFEAMPDHPMLHAALLRFKHPHTGETMTFKQTPPKDFMTCAANLNNWP